MPAPPRSENPAHRPCPACGELAAALLYDLSRLSRPGAFPGWIVRCRECGLVFKRWPRGAGVEELYGEGYGPRGELLENYFLGPAARRFARGVLRRLGPPPAAGEGEPALLDVGCGPGLFLEEAVAAGWEARGVDLAPANVERARARGLAVERRRVEELPGEGRFAAVTLLDLIEHLEDPAATLGHVRHLLRPGGRLAVYTPNHRGAVVSLGRLLHRLGMERPVEEVFGSNHVVFFDDRTLPALLTRAGFRVERLWRFPYDPRRPGQPISPLELAAVAGVELAGWPFGRVFRMVAFARVA